ncbi:hypothetical protein BMS3Bbin01_02773 [bacterium BMS3Bbin01]|nr:hypothetical protein BMS3Bbin01_02773 [bacterium BMS3Bbin01]
MGPSALVEHVFDDRLGKDLARDQSPLGTLEPCLTAIPPKRGKKHRPHLHLRGAGELDVMRKFMHQGAIEKYLWARHAHRHGSALRVVPGAVVECVLGDKGYTAETALQGRERGNKRLPLGIGHFREVGRHRPVDDQLRGLLPPVCDDHREKEQGDRDGRGQDPSQSHRPPLFDSYADR